MEKTTLGSRVKQTTQDEIPFLLTPSLFNSLSKLRCVVQLPFQYQHLVLKKD